MAKDKTTGSDDFPVARRVRSAAAEMANDLEPKGNDASQEKDSLITSDPVAQKSRSEERRLVSQEGLDRLRSLRRQQAREAQRFINVPLDPELKRRLNRAAIENDVKMAAIVRDALRKYLDDAGY